MHFGHTIRWACSPGGKVKFHIRGRPTPTGTPGYHPCHCYTINGKNTGLWYQHITYITKNHVRNTPISSNFRIMKEWPTPWVWHSSTCFDDHDPTIELLRPFHSNNQWATTKKYMGHGAMHQKLACYFHCPKFQSPNSVTLKIASRTSPPKKKTTTSKSFALQATHRRTMQAATWVRKTARSPYRPLPAPTGPGYSNRIRVTFLIPKKR